MKVVLRTILTATLVALFALSCRSSNLRGNEDSEHLIQPGQHTIEAQELFERHLQEYDQCNPCCRTERVCERKWYCAWGCKKCEDKRICCYNVHRYSFTCYGAVSREKLYYYPNNCNPRFDKSCKEQSFTKTRPCLGYEHSEGCFNNFGVKLNNCPTKWGSSMSGFVKVICD